MSRVNESTKPFACSQGKSATGVGELHRGPGTPSYFAITQILLDGNEVKETIPSLLAILCCNEKNNISKTTL